MAAVSPLARTPDSKYDRLIVRAKSVPAATTLVVHPCDETSLRGATEAAEAGITAFLAHDAARLITGEALYVDGGYHIID